MAARETEQSSKRWYGPNLVMDWLWRGRRKGNQGQLQGRRRHHALSQKMARAKITRLEQGALAMSFRALAQPPSLSPIKLLPHQPPSHPSEAPILCPRQDLFTPSLWQEPYVPALCLAGSSSWVRYGLKCHLLGEVIPDHLHLKPPHRSPSHCPVLFSPQHNHCAQLPPVAVHTSIKCPFPASLTLYSAAPRTVAAQSSCLVNHRRRDRGVNGRSGARLG